MSLMGRALLLGRPRRRAGMLPTAVVRRSSRHPAAWRSTAGTHVGHLLPVATGSFRVGHHCSYHSAMAALHESVEFVGPSALSDTARDDVFRYCKFHGLDIDGAGLEGIVVGCTFVDSTWYWGLFTTARFVEVEFRGCIFLGCSFANCVFTLCRFVDCQFTKDNLGGDCRYSECAWYDCWHSGCEGLPESVASKP